MRRPALLCCVLLAALWARPLGADVRGELLVVTPDELLGADVGSLAARATEAHRAKRWEEAARAWLAVLRRQPGDREALYDLACCCAQLELPGKSAELLAAAWAAGFRDLEHLRQDPELDPIRGSKEYKELLAVLEADLRQREQRGGRELVVTTPLPGSVRVVAPRPAADGRGLPLLVVLHGGGGTNDEIAGNFAAVAGGELIVCAPRGPYAVPGEHEPAFAWRPEDLAGGRELAVDLAEQLVLAAVDAVAAEYPVEPGAVYLAGFSQGAWLAYRLGLHHPERFRGVAPIGGWLEPELYHPAQLERAARQTRFLVAHSPADTVVPFARSEEAVKLLAAHDVPYEVVRYEGGHVMTTGVVERIATWIRSRAGGKPADSSPPETEPGRD